MKELTPEQVESVSGGTGIIQGLTNVLAGRRWDDTPIHITGGKNPFAEPQEAPKCTR